MPLKVVPRRDRKLNRLVKAADPETVRKNRIIYRRGDEAETVFLIQTGHVRLTHRRRGGRREATVAVVGPWELLGVEALGAENPRRYNAVTGESCVLLPLPGRRVLKALRGSPTTLAMFIQAMEEDRAVHRSMSGAPSKARIADVILDLAHRFGREGDGQICIGHWFTHQELADLAGVHRSTVTTTVNDWIYDGILHEGQKSLIIDKLGALEKAGSRPG